MFDVCVAFLLFLFYSFLGWGMEVIVCSIKEKKLMDRGFLVGPYCPIYGSAALLMITFLSKHIDTPVTLFILAVVLASIVEYITSFLMEKIFAARWWDYSHLPFNVNGRICLGNSLLFGILGVILIYVAEPRIEGFISHWNQLSIIISAGILFILFIIDIVISCNVTVKIRKTLTTLNTIKKDNTIEVNEKIKATLIQQSILLKRLLNAFPHSVIKIHLNKKKSN